ncbi:protein kinase [Actinoallomurus sp. NBC_01490]|uniref:protein kinase domain-containing protein n=1 Tax=Actinoallomurus sp. NBC_01490 TaxID=2903557 RepID=UPI002E359DE7|nr:protein kinase [Actinoallomurus sp. NBC_01490]
MAGRYELHTTLGRGGMGVVHKGLDRELGRTVAVKLLPPELLRQPDFRARFRREGRTAAALSHGSIAVMHDIGEDTADGQPVPYLVMEYVDGTPLNEVIAAGPLPLDQVRTIIANVLDALEHSHRNGIVHRDIKPANVMVDLRGSRPRVKILDFGIAKLMADTATRLTATGHMVGTALYMSPEQAEGHGADAKSDIYAVGCMLYELLTGRPPLTAETPTAVLLQHIRQTPQPPSARRPDLPPAWDEVVMRALAKRPEDRYADAAEMQAAVLATDGAPAPRVAPDAIGVTRPAAEGAPAARPAGRGIPSAVPIAPIAPTVPSPQPPPPGPPGHDTGHSEQQSGPGRPEVLSNIGIVCWVLLPPAAIVLGLVAQKRFRAQGRPDTRARVAWIGGVVMTLLGLLGLIF